MRLLIALLLPWLVFFTIRRPWQGIFCLILQITLIGWPVAAIWAVYALSQYNTERKIEDYHRSQDRND
ncbi:YqaE/Pmp3 family membrane protein [Seohaeicola saemankumensis]|nr:YqaE/Pmp3 family membrane protein [Seohaeicola saemankumensis]MCA0869598.1 YqaE/Pmp3 family membrane protein [Seohaeicola saemankumensis]